MSDLATQAARALADKAQAVSESLMATAVELVDECYMPPEHVQHMQEGFIKAKEYERLAHMFRVLAGDVNP